MAQHTKQPDVLRELFEALGNDPFVIAECLARPALAERSITNWYAYDQRIHGELKQRAEGELQAHPAIEQMKQLSGRYTEIEIAKSDAAQRKSNRGAKQSVKLNSHDWEKTVKKLAATFDKPGRRLLNGRDGSPSRPPDPAKAYETIPIGKPSPLQEDETRYYATAVLNKTTDRLKVSTVSWLKDPFESWRDRAETQQVSNVLLARSYNYTLPSIAEGGCIDDTWTALNSPPEGREFHTTVWTGTEMIVWGGQDGSFTLLNTGGRYNPSTDSWSATSGTNAPDARTSHTAVWTGSEMIVWGGADQLGDALNTGGRYNPDSDSWIGTSIVSAPGGRYAHTAVWIGNEMVVWGGWDGSPPFNTGGRYNPNTDSWTTTTVTNAPEARTNHTAIWTGSEMIVWGGNDQFSGALNTGARYNPTTNSWTATGTTDAPIGRWDHTAIWTGNEMIVWGGTDESFNFFNTGGKYNPNTDSWAGTNTAGAPDGRDLHTAVWTGSRMIVWGGFNFTDLGLNTGGLYDPNTDSWTETSTSNAPSARDSHCAVWTGTEMVVWGGEDE